ncbi:MAG: hypothetical protein IPM76_20635 [Chloroflexi bacterium]|nr:hypothetical protein [Chloroflexota bacterium]
MQSFVPVEEAQEKRAVGKPSLLIIAAFVLINACRPESGGGRRAAMVVRAPLVWLGLRQASRRAAPPLSYGEFLHFPSGCVVNRLGSCADRPVGGQFLARQVIWLVLNRPCSWATTHPVLLICACYGVDCYTWLSGGLLSWRPPPPFWRQSLRVKAARAVAARPLHRSVLIFNPLNY